MYAETDLSVAYNSKAIQLYYLIVQATTLPLPTTIITTHISHTVCCPINVKEQIVLLKSNLQIGRLRYSIEVTCPESFSVSQ